MDQREMEKEIWRWLHGYAFNIGESVAFIETLEDRLIEEDVGHPSRRQRKWLGIDRQRLTDAEYDRMVRAGKRVAEIIDRKAGYR